MKKILMVITMALVSLGSVNTMAYTKPHEQMYAYGKAFEVKAGPSDLLTEVKLFVSRSTRSGTVSMTDTEKVDAILHVYKTIVKASYGNQDHVNAFIATLYYEDVYHTWGGEQALERMCKRGIISAKGYCWK